jgi:hypothetical protein
MKYNHCGECLNLGGGQQCKEAIEDERMHDAEVKSETTRA